MWIIYVDIFFLKPKDRVINGNINDREDQNKTASMHLELIKMMLLQSSIQVLDQKGDQVTVIMISLNLIFLR